MSELTVEGAEAEFGQLVKERLKEKNLTQAGFVRELRRRGATISQSYISRILSGERIPTRNPIFTQTLREVLGVTYGTEATPILDSDLGVKINLNMKIDPKAMPGFEDITGEEARIFRVSMCIEIGKIVVGRTVETIEDFLEFRKSQNSNTSIFDRVQKALNSER